MSVIWSIAKATFKESMQKKIMWVFFGIALLIIGLSFIFSYFSPSEELVLIKSIGLGIIYLFGVLIALIITAGLIPTEIERRTLHTVLSKPIERWQFVVGKFIGVALVLFMNMMLMAIALLIVVMSKGSARAEGFFKALVTNSRILEATLLLFFYLLILSAFAILFSIFSTTNISITLSAFVFVIGSLSDYVADIIKLSHNPLTSVVLKVLHLIVPNFGNASIYNSVIHGYIPAGEAYYVLMAIAYSLAYCLVLMILSTWIFAGKEV
jgi:ABC-type transport system involved in multi-copper enzyme maturation permease subunit